MEIGLGPQQWAKIRRDYTAWWEGALDRPLVYIPHVAAEGPQPQRPAIRGFMPQYPADVPVDRIVDDLIAHYQGHVYVGDTFPYFFMNFGAGILAGFMGCRVDVRPETVWFEPADGADLGKLSLELQTEGFWWRRAMDLTTCAVQRMGDRVQISHLDLGGNADILASMVGAERLLMDLIDRPDEAAAAMRRITELWLRAYDTQYELIRQRCPGTVPFAPIWAPGTGYMLQSDFSYMISPDMFGRFVVPDLEACCEHLEYPFYHMDGVGELPHLDLLLGIRKLRGIQWVPGDGKPPPDQWPDVLRRIRDGGKLCQATVSADGARRICRELGGRGFHLAIRTQLTPAEARELYEELTA